MGTYVFLALVAVSLSTGEKCFAPMICNNVPTWARISMAGEDGTCGNQMKHLEDKAGNLDRSIDEMFERLEYLETLKSTTMPVTVDKTKEVSDDEKLATQADHTTTGEPVTTREIETTGETSTAGLTTSVATIADAADDTTTGEPVTTREIEATGETSTAGLTTNVATTVDADNCDVEYNSKCFRAIVHSTLDTNFTDAQKICNDMGWEIANIYDVTHYRLLENYLHAIIPSGWGWIRLWTGMSYKSNKLHLTSGSEVILDGAWFPEFPDPVASRINIAVEIKRANQSKYQGILNSPPSYRYHGVICEI